MTNHSSGAKPTSRQRVTQLTARVSELDSELGKAQHLAKQWMQLHSQAAYGNLRAKQALARGASADEVLAILNEDSVNTGVERLIGDFVDAMVKDWTEKPISTFTRSSVRDWIDRQRTRLTK